MKLLARLDASLAVTRPLWHWLGQVALVILGAHLGADRLDDALGRWLADLPLAWPDTQTPFEVGTWGALGLEILVTLWAVRTLARTMELPVVSAREWFTRLSVHNVLAPLFWLPVSLAGCWTIIMAVEDLVPFQPQVATPIAWFVGVLVAVRLTGTGLYQLIICAPRPKRRIEGVLWFPVLATIGWFSTRYGLPIWGWL